MSAAETIPSGIAIASAGAMSQRAPPRKAAIASIAPMAITTNAITVPLPVAAVNALTRASAPRPIAASTANPIMASPRPAVIGLPGSRSRSSA